MAIPGYLQVTNLADYRLRKKIAAGGLGEIHLVDLFGAELVNRADGSKTGVAKIPLCKHHHMFESVIAALSHRFMQPTMRRNDSETCSTRKSVRPRSRPLLFGADLTQLF